MNHTVVICGRPNVGKSTLFNALIKENKALVEDRPGVTRDRLYGFVKDKEKEEGFLLIDTGGFETKGYEFQPFGTNLVWQQTQEAIQSSDIVLFVLDGKDGLHPLDEELFRYLRTTEKHIIAVINKIDGESQKDRQFEFYKLGINAFLTTSAAHRRGLDVLKDDIWEKLTEISQKPFHKLPNEEALSKIAIIGRPNAGKSSLINRLLGEERSIVSPIPGTTRDAVDATFNFNQHVYQIVDTAGIRRQTKIKDMTEAHSTWKSISQLKKSDLILYVIDALEGLTDQDARLINLGLDLHKPTMLVVNKWDLVPEKSAATSKIYEENIRRIMKDSAFIPVYFVSCLTNQRVHKLKEHIETIFSQYNKKVQTSEVNQALQEILKEHPPQLIKKYAKKIKFYYATQVKTAPPTIVVKCNVAQEVTTAYKRFMVKAFRRHLGFEQVPIYMILRGKSAEDSATI